MQVSGFVAKSTSTQKKTGKGRRALGSGGKKAIGDPKKEFKKKSNSRHEQDHGRREGKRAGMAVARLATWNGHRLKGAYAAKPERSIANRTL